VIKLDPHRFSHEICQIDFGFSQKEVGRVEKLENLLEDVE